MTANDAGIVRLVGLVVILVWATCAIAGGMGKFERFNWSEEERKEIDAWFNSNGISFCCDKSDGHPTKFEYRADGIYIPNPYTVDYWDMVDNPERYTDHSLWMKVPANAYVKHQGNPIGAAVVWTIYRYQWSGSPRMIRCFLGQTEI